MADDIVEITLTEGSFVDQEGKSATYTGSFQVDYTTGTVSGDFKVEGDGFGDSGHFERLLVQNGDQYTVTGEGFSVIYTGQTPTTAEVQLVANGNDTYDTANNPPGDQTAMVTATTSSSASACFVAGTLIATPDGETPVEDLRPGDLVRLATGGTARIAWLGHRRAAGARVIRFAPHSLPVGPTAELRVSADHAMFLDGALVPAALLVNGATVTSERLTTVTFHHVELETHGILLANGAPAESYIDTGNRAKFANCALAYDPAFATADPCAPLILAGTRLDAIRALLPATAQAPTPIQALTPA